MTNLWNLFASYIAFALENHPRLTSSSRLRLMQKSSHIFVILILSFSITSCKSKETLFEGMAMNIPYRVIVAQKLTKEEKEKITQIIEETFEETNQIYNNWNPHSEISELSRLKKKEIVTLSPKLQALLELADHLYKISDGKFDVTIAPLLPLWKEGIPNTTSMPYIGWNTIHLNGNQFFKDFDETTFDLCAISKGFTVDALLQNLAQTGFANTFVEWGGEIGTRGSHRHKQPWKILIAQTSITLPLTDQTIATSGDTYQSWSLNGTTYTHIINPLTKTPLTIEPHSLSSATVITSSCALADGLATILMQFPTPATATSWLHSHYPETPCFFTTHP